MLSKYIKNLTSQDSPVVLSITETTTEATGKTVIQRNNVRRREETVNIYLRAREIYFRARRQRPVRAVSIF